MQAGFGPNVELDIFVVIDVDKVLVLVKFDVVVLVKVVLLEDVVKVVVLVEVFEVVVMTLFCTYLLDCFCIRWCGARY